MTASTSLVRLQRFIAQAGIAARRKAEELITSGRVTVDGVVVTELGTKVDPATANVQVDGEPVAPQEHFYVLMNKPKGCITAVTDDRGRPTVMDYLTNLPVPVAPVGRLDFYSEGVLLLTNDGELAARLLAPASHVPKTYHVKLDERLGPGELKRLRDGITLDDGTTTAPAEVSVLPADSKHPWLAFTLHEGKSRQIHRMVEALGHRVLKLQRVAFANLTFHGLRIGDARELTQGELNDLRALVGLGRTEVARGRWEAKREDTDRPRAQRAAAQAELEANRAFTQAGQRAAAERDDDGDDDEGAFERQLAATRGRGPRGRAPSGAGARREPSSIGRSSSGGRPSSGGFGASRGPSSGGRPSSGGFGASRGPSSGGPSSRGPSSGGRPSGGGFGASRGPSSGGPSRGPSSRGPSSGGRPSSGGFGASRGPSSGGRSGGGGFGASRGPSSGGRPTGGASRGPSSGGRPTGSASRGPSSGGPSRGPSSGGPSSRGPSSGGRPTGGPSRGPSSRGPSSGSPSRGPSSGSPSRGPSSRGPSSGGPSRGPSSGARPTGGGRPASGGRSGRPTPGRPDAGRPNAGRAGGRKGPPRR